MEEIFVDEIRDSMNSEYISSIYNESNFEISFSFKSDFKNTKYLREYLIVILSVIGVDTTWKNRFVLILDELNNNAIEYGSKNGSINRVRINSKKIGNELFISIEVEDSGDGEKTKKASEMENLKIKRLVDGFSNYRSIRGRGLFMIIHKLVDNIYFRDSKNGGLIVGVNKKLSC